MNKVAEKLSTGGAEPEGPGTEVPQRGPWRSPAAEAGDRHFFKNNYRKRRPIRPLRLLYQLSGLKLCLTMSTFSFSPLLYATPKDDG